jgi:hypothetical protein
MTTFLQNLPMICLLIALSSVAICGVYSFINLPRQKQIQALEEWLKWAVVMAEKKLGSGTGQLKLREVYEMAIAQFPWIAKSMEFEYFKCMVDEALQWMRKQLEDNKAIDEYVNG